MKLRRFKPSKVLAKDQMRPVLTAAHIAVEEVEVPIVIGGKRTKKVPRLFLYATDSYTFVRIDLGEPDPTDNPGPVPGVALRHMEKGVNVELGKTEIKAGITRYDRVYAEHVSNSSHHPYTRWKGIQPVDEEEQFILSLNPDYLKNLADAMGVGKGEGVRIVVNKSAMKPTGDKGKSAVYSAMRVVAPRYGAEGLIMPIRVEQ